MNTRPRAIRSGLTLVELLAVIAIIGLLVGLLLPAVQSARESARRTKCTSNLREWSQAMLQHHQAMSFLPYLASRAIRGQAPGTEDPLTAAGNVAIPLRSFIVPLWPFVDNQPLYDQYDAWLQAGSYGQLPAAFRTPIELNYCPSDKPGARYCPRGISGTACGVRQNYVVNSGTFSAIQSIGGWTATTNTQQARPVAPFGFAKGHLHWNFTPFHTSLNQILDGCSNTLLMSEIRVFPFDEGRLPGNGWAHADADTRGVVTSGINTPAFMTFSTPNSGIDNCQGVSGCDFTQTELPCTAPGSSLLMTVSARSRHAGGVNASLCDGSVRFIGDDIAMNIWRALSTIRNQELLEAY